MMTPIPPAKVVAPSKIERNDVIFSKMSPLKNNKIYCKCGRHIQIQLGNELNTVIEKIVFYLIYSEYQTVVSYFHKHAMK